TPFGEKIERVTAETAGTRNRLMAELADEIFIAYAQKGGNLENLISEWLEMKKPIYTFENEINKRSKP
ncbi:DNA-binding protein, partial [Candidatus Desantisbacteria bacterium]|nr:DNA-binding protein [Candidatus Desantisbacteria bacterium]